MRGINFNDEYQVLESYALQHPTHKYIFHEYLKEHFNRFLTIYNLIKEINGKCLELGASPYFLSLLLDRNTGLELTLNNYFGVDHTDTEGTVHIEYHNPITNRKNERDFFYHHFNIEDTIFPFDKNTFDLVLFSEIIEHLVNNPAQVLEEINRVLKPGGSLVISTPNVTKIENIVKLSRGENIYHPYSIYGPYGRHNREYTIQELILLLEHYGFSLQKGFTKDTSPIYPPMDSECEKIKSYIKRKFDLGQYIFLHGIKHQEVPNKKPSFLYDGYSSNKIEKIKIESPNEKDIVDECIISLNYNWHNIELWGGVPSRWMWDLASLLVFSNKEKIAKMKFNAISYLKPRKLQIYCNNLIVFEREVSCHSVSFELEVGLNEGLNLINFITPDGSDKPCCNSWLKSDDDRNLSIAFQNIVFI